MDEISGASQVGMKNPAGRVSSKPQVSSEGVKTAEKTEGAKELKDLEFQREGIDHAFALITDIRERIEKAYDELSSSQEGG